MQLLHLYALALLDEIVMVGLAQACTGIGMSGWGSLFMDGWLVGLSIRMDVVIETSLAYIYAKNGLLELAGVVF